MSGLVAGLEAGERPQVVDGERAVLAGDGVAVRAGARVAELLGQARLDLGAEDVLELARLFVHGVPRHVEVVDQEALAEPVTPHEDRALGLAGRGEGDAPALGRLRYKAVRTQAPEHLGNRRRGNTQLGRESRHRDRVRAPLQLEERLEVLLDALGACAHGSSPFGGWWLAGASAKARPG